MKDSSEGMDLKGRDVLVLGIGASGAAAAKLLLQKGARVTCSDRCEEEDVQRKAAFLRGLGCRVELGAQREDFARGAELSVISPGIDPSIPLVRELAHDGIPIISEIELAFRFCACPVIAVTGTNGKTTVVTLLEKVLLSSGRRAVACGNIGRPFSEVVAGENSPELVVLEVSSFQLEAIREFTPWIGVILNITDDHLDRYAGLEDYARAKAALFRNQGSRDWAVVRAEDKSVWEKYEVLGRQSELLFSASETLDNGACVEEDTLLMKRGGRREEICRRRDVALVGEHNIENVLAVAAISSICGVVPGVLRETIRSFHGLPHRMEPIVTRGGVRYINDSKATNPGAVIRALQSLEGPVLLIAGGKDKGFDYSVLRQDISKKVKAVILIGEARERMRRALDGVTEALYAETLAEAVGLAAERAVPGDTVLLSPACSSYDMFENFEERGEVFKRCVWGVTKNDTQLLGSRNSGVRSQNEDASGGI
ncbi:MAG: UDP-N-acetylmuramoyl-L-alanine--D-glutamate ligase [Candidatus Aureabacteria bacterium]|nr:UDP-N-acetylmuramoyl-L-alanine--D-glutamate ligase [Candidatus Auribacterota bacterium]